MLMFMEYCDTGTIEEAAKMGLPEYLIRRYTREIVLAVNHLHENSIVHRDIKGNTCYYLHENSIIHGDIKGNACYYPHERSIVHKEIKDNACYYLH